MSTSSTGSPPASLDEIVAINREIAALARAGIPLELGLRSFAGGLQNNLSRLADRIADRLSAGQTLAQAIEQEGDKSPVYAAVISAGLQSGQLPETLEAVAASAELIQETRSDLARSMVYPIAVLVLAYILLAGFVWLVVPTYVATATDFGFGQDRVFEVLKQVHATEPIWVWVVPLIVLGAVVLLRWNLRDGPLLFLPRLLGRAQFAELLKIQIAHGLPLGPAFRRAADGSGDRVLRRVADSVCRDVESGVPFPTAISAARGLPPLMTWMLATGARQGTLVKSLELIRDSCRRRAERWSYLLKTWVPVVVTLVIGGTMALLYGLLNFIPLRAFWEGLMRE